MCSRGIYLIGIDENALVRFRCQSDCESWSCDECKRLLTRRWRKRIYMHVKLQKTIYNKQFNFITLTSNTSSFDTYKDTKKIWNTLTQNLRRRQKGFQYCAVWEQHKSQRYHIHLLTDFQLDDLYKYHLRDYKAMTRSRTLDQLLNRYSELGWVHHVEKVKDEYHASSYVAKYLAKSFAHMTLEKRQRLILTSRGWWREPERTSALTFIKVSESLYKLSNEELQAWVDATINIE